MLIILLVLHIIAALYVVTHKPCLTLHNLNLSLKVFISKTIQFDHFKCATIVNSFMINLTKKFEWVTLSTTPNIHKT